jgi:hypothetical protein
MQLPVIELQFITPQLKQKPRKLLIALLALATSLFKLICEIQMPSRQWLILWPKSLVLLMSS